MSTRTRTSPRPRSVARGVVLGLGAVAAVPAAAHADPQPDPGDAGPPVSKLDPADRAIRNASAGPTDPVPTQPAAPPRVQRMGLGDFEPTPAPAAPKPAATKPRPATPKPDPAPVKAHVQRIGRGDFTSPDPVKPKPKPKPEPAPITAHVQRISRGDLDPNATQQVPTPQFDPRSLLPPRIQRFGLADMGPDRYPVLDIGTGGVAKLNPQSPGYGLSYPGGEGATNSVTVGCGAGGAAKTKVAVKCTLVPQVGLGKKGRHRATPKAKVGATLDITRTSTAGRTPDTMTPQGKRASLLVTTETSTKVGVEAKLKKLDVSYKKITDGHKTTYQITGTPARIAQIASDPSLAPDVRDPRTIETGDGVLIGEENFDGSESSASVNNTAGIENSQVAGTRQSAGVQRVNTRTIRITVGDDAFVRQVIKAGLGNSVAGVGIANTWDDAEGKARQVDLDISTPTGWADYQAFLRTGRLDYHPGLTFATMDRHTSTGSHGFYVKLGPFEHSETLSSGNEEVRDLKHSDGSKERYFIRRYNDVTVYTDTRKGGDGPATPTTRYLLLDGANAGLVERYRERAGSPARSTDWEGKANVRIAFTDADLRRVRENAITWYRQHLNRDVGGDLDRAGTVKYARTDYATYPIGQQAAFDIVRAHTPDEVLMALYAGSDGQPDAVLDELERNADSQDGGPMPGRLVDLP